MKAKLVGAIATVASVWVSSALALPCTSGLPCQLDVTYSGVISSGNDATGLWGSIGSLAGASANISFIFDLANGGFTFTSDATSSQYLSFGPSIGSSPAQVSILVSSGGGTAFGNAPNGVAVDQATVGSTSQSISLVLPTFNEAFSIVASASNAAIPSSILQDFTLTDIPLSVAFSLSGTNNPFCTLPACNFNISGNITSGNLSVELVNPDERVNPTPLPAALPLFASGLGAMGLFGWWRRRKRPN